MWSGIVAPKGQIEEMMGHSNSVVTEHYLAGLEKKKKINSVLGPEEKGFKPMVQTVHQEIKRAFSCPF